jgi:RNA polymerase sigma-70 factor (ECF subfamily)
MDPDDKKLVTDFLEGDSEALGGLLERYLNLVYRFAFRITRDSHDAEDVTQATFIKVWHNLHKFDVEKNFRTWLLSIAHNSAIDLLRKRKSFVFSDFDTLEGGNSITDALPDPTPLPPEIFSRAEDKKFLDSALSELSPAFQEILILHHEEGLTFSEISSIVSKPLNTVKSQYRRALLTLRRNLEQPR